LLPNRLGYETENRLKNMLVAVGDGERILENLRQSLCAIRDFAPHSAFQRIDRDGSNRIHQTELIQFMREHQNYGVTENEGYHLVKFFDSDNDGCLSFSDF